MAPRTVSTQLGDEQKTLVLLEEAARRDGLNPRSFLGLLSHAIETRAWEHLPDGPISFLEYIKRAHLDEDSLEKALALPIERESEDERERFDRTRREARGLIEEATPLGNHGGVREQGQVDNINLQGGTGESYIRRRLHRDREDLYGRVAAGEVSARAAGIEAGFVKPTASIRVDSPDAAIKALLRRFTRDELLAALNGAP